MKRLLIKLIIAMIAFICLGTFLIISFMNNRILKKPEDTSLEFWITQNVSNVDFSNYNLVSGVFGAYQYYNKEYGSVAVDDTAGIYTPDSCVVYTVSGYPDASKAWEYITQIDITDSNISVYGITCNSTVEEFDEAYRKIGCKIQIYGSVHAATYGKTKVQFFEGSRIMISVEVTNKYGVMF